MEGARRTGEARPTLAAGVAMAADYFFAVKSIGQSTCNGRKASTLLGAARHNKRQIQAEQGTRGNIDPARTSQNEVIAGPATPEEIDALARALMAGAGIAKLRKNCAQAIELVFSLPPGAAIDAREYFQSCAVWAGAQFGPDNILSADIHRDEPASIHCHVLVLPLAGGKMQGSALISKPATRALTKSFFEAVAAQFGLRRPSPALAGEKRAMAARDVLERLGATADPVMRSALWPTVKREIERDPAPYMQNLGLVAREPKRKPGKTMVQIFTGTGKGPRREKVEAETPIGFEEVTQMPIGISKQTEKTQTLSCVGIGKTALPEALAKPATATRHQPGELEHLPTMPERRQLATGAQDAAIAGHATTAPAQQASRRGYAHDAGTDSPQAGTGTQTARADRPAVALALTADAATRRQVAHVAAADATRRHANRAPPPPADRGDRITREADADFDVAAWRAA